MDTSANMKYYRYKNSQLSLVSAFFGVAYITLFAIAILCATQIIAGARGMSDIAVRRWNELVGMPFLFGVLALFIVCTVVTTIYVTYKSLSGRSYVQNRNLVYVTSDNKLYLYVFQDRKTTSPIMNDKRFFAYNLWGAKENTATLFYAVDYTALPEKVYELTDIDVRKSRRSKIKFMAAARYMDSQGVWEETRKKYCITRDYEDFEELQNFILHSDKVQH